MTQTDKKRTSFEVQGRRRRKKNQRKLTENIPPQTAKFPAMIGDRALIDVKLPICKDNIERVDNEAQSFLQSIASQQLKVRKTYKSTW